MPTAWPRPVAATDPTTRTSGLDPAQTHALQSAARAIRDGAMTQALQQLDGVLHAAPEHPEVLRLTGIAHTRAGQFGQAVAMHQRALVQWPDDPLILTDLGNARQASGHTEAALDAWRQACATAPDYPMAWFNLGRNLQQLGRAAEAVPALTRAAALDPRLLPAHVLLGDAQAHLGQFDEAACAYRRALGVHPASGDAWRGLANIKTHPLSDADREQLSKLLQRQDLAPTDRIALGFALGKVCEDQGCYTEAFAALAAANAQQQRLAPWNATGFHALVERVRAASTALPAPIDNSLGKEVIFLVGLPRSGSTLFEQILAAHPQVEGASELPDLPEVLMEESARRGQAWPAWMAQASAQDWQRLGRRYLARTARWREQRPCNTDKLPENWLYAGLLGAMLPGARLIDVRRDPLETGWSCFKQPFHRLPHFACSLADIAAYIRDCESAMDAWQANAPTRIRIQHYEALLADPAGEIRALLDFCNLPFAAACLDFHRAERAVRTPSASQVRQPLDRQTARAVHYGALLDPLRHELAPASR